MSKLKCTTTIVVFHKKGQSLTVLPFSCSTALIVTVVARPSDESLENLNAVVAKVKE